MNLPKSKNKNIIVQEAGKELLIYDLTANKVFNLNETSKIVYQNCDNQRSFSELKIKYGFTDEYIFLALDELKRNGLIEDSYKSPFEGISRREVIRRVGIASMLALPIISALAAPKAANAASAVGTCQTGLGNSCFCTSGVTAGQYCGAGDINPCASGCSCLCVTPVGPSNCNGTCSEPQLQV